VLFFVLQRGGQDGSTSPLVGGDFPSHLPWRGDRGCGCALDVTLVIAQVMANGQIVLVAAAALTQRPDVF